MGNKILIINCGAGGDILNCTPIAKHHKIVEPDCEITWLTSKKYAHILKNNKNIDNLIIYEVIQSQKFVNHVDMTMFIQKHGKDLISQYDVAKFVAPYYYIYTATGTLDLTTKEDSLLNIIKTKTSGIEQFACDFIPDIYLSTEEIDEANSFFNNIKDDSNSKLLLEYESFSDQTPFNLSYITFLCEYAEDKDISIIFTGKNKPSYFDSLKNNYSTNFYFYSGSFMSNAQLYNLCDYYVGCSSGVTCLTHSGYCDTKKTRIEVTRGMHWSTFEWKHMQNKFIVTTVDQFRESLKFLKR